MLFVKNKYTGFRNYLITKIRSNEKWLSRWKRVLGYKRVWQHMESDDDSINVSWCSQLNGSLLVVCRRNSTNHRNFSAIRKYVPGIKLVELKDCVDEVKRAQYDGVIVCIQHDTSVERSRYSEVLVALYSRHLNVYPALVEGAVYENKRCLRDVCVANDIAIPDTKVFDAYSDLDQALPTISFPAILKSSMGAGASGVIKITSSKMLMKYAKLAFGSGLNRKMADYRDKDWGYILVQEYIPNLREYRVIKIGESWFAHEKIANDQGFHSGSGNSRWISPELALLEFCWDVANKLKINIAAFDIFETTEGRYLVNEIQCWFGSYSPSQMYVDGKPGRYIKKNHGWEFEEGEYNVYGGALLRATVLLNEMKIKEIT